MKALLAAINGAIAGMVFVEWHRRGGTTLLILWCLYTVIAVGHVCAANSRTVQDA